MSLLCLHMLSSRGQIKTGLGFGTNDLLYLEPTVFIRAASPYHKKLLVFDLIYNVCIRNLKNGPIRVTKQLDQSTLTLL